MTNRRTGLAFLLAASAAACGDDPKPTPPAPSPKVGTVAPAPQPRARPEIPLELPEADPLSDDASRRLLVEAIEADAGTVVVREALLALAESSGADAVRSATGRMLRCTTEGTYGDTEAAAIALEARLLAGDADAVGPAIELAKQAGEDVSDAHATMLARLTGPREPEARQLLVQILRDAQDDLSMAAPLEALARVREPSAAQRFHEIATSPDVRTDVRGTAAAGLLGINDPRANAVLESLVRATRDDAAPEESLTSFDVMDGLAVEGIAEALPWIHRIADPILEADENSALEIRSLAYAYVTIRGPGKGTPEDVAALRKVLGKSDGLSDEDVLVALWTLGDDTQADAAAKALADSVIGMAAVQDEETGVAILNALAARGGARRKPFSRPVDAAAAVAIPSDPQRPDAPERAWRLRVAAARAYLLSKR